jgi:hypothetical protein
MWYNGRTGKYNGSLQFDGTDDYVEIPDTTNSPFDTTDQITVSAWIYPTSNLTNYKRIVDKDYRTSWYFGSRQNNNNHLSVWINNGERAYTADNIIPLNTWSHVAFTYNKDAGSDQVKIYRNGILVGKGTYSTAISNNNNSVMIGESFLSYPGYVFPGKIDEVKFWNYALTPEQVRLEYNGGSAVRFSP